MDAEKNDKLENCPKCGKPIELNWKLCPECETPLTSENYENQDQRIDRSKANIKDSIVNIKETKTNKSESSLEADTKPHSDFQSKIGSGFDSINNPKSTELYKDPKIDTLKNANIQDSVVNVHQNVSVDKIQHTYIYNEDKYKFQNRPINTSGIFRTFLALDNNGKKVICKELPEQFQESVELHNFLYLGKMLEKTSGIARYIGVEEIRGRCYLVRDYCEGESIGDQFRKKYPFRDTEIWSIINKILLILRLVQNKNLGNHGSLRLENIFFNSRQEIMLSDFGIGRIKDFIARKIPEFKKDLDRYFADKEPWRSELPDHQYDVFALGMLIQICLTEKELLNVSTDANRFSDYRKSYDAEPDRNLVELMDQALNKNFKTTSDLRARVERYSPIDTGIHKFNFNRWGQGINITKEL
jgi:hypothetical protein